MKGDISLEFKRDIYESMLEWKESNKVKKTALEIQGARQVGKTFIIQKFAEENYKYAIYINLFSQDTRDKIEYIQGKSMNILEILKIFEPEFIDNKDTVIVIDEIQEYSYIYII